MTDRQKYICLNCKSTSFDKKIESWECENCNTVFEIKNGIPRLFLENEIGIKDKTLRDYFYNGLLGRFYQILMPFLTLPARPIMKSIKGWLIYISSWIFVIFLIWFNIRIFSGGISFNSTLNVLLIFIVFSVSFGIVRFFIKHPYFIYLLLFAIPVKISLSKSNFQPDNKFLDIHKKIIDKLLETNNRKLQVLDISTGTGNSLFRHGWMKLNADYTGIDLSEIMLNQCRDFMSSNNISMDLVLGDAVSLPFNDNYFDIVLNYGAINGYSNIEKALKEMVRVVKKDGLVLILDEQLYPNATKIEKLYFDKVLSSHNFIHKCPVDLIPDDAYNINVYQVYEFYYICTFSVRNEL